MKNPDDQSAPSSNPHAPRERGPSDDDPELAIDPKWKWHYNVLNSLRDRLLRRGDRIQAAVKEPIEQASTHPADSATDAFEHDVALTLLAREQNALAEVTDAIVRIRDGTYGFCLATKVAIPAERLRAVPWCRYTVEVEEQLKSTDRIQMPDVQSLRGVGATIPGTGTIPPEGAEHEAKRPDEPNPGTATVDADVHVRPEENERSPGQT